MMWKDKVDRWIDFIFVFFIDNDECGEDACGNSGNCVDDVNSFSCDCPVDQTGLYCQRGKHYRNMSFTLSMQATKYIVYLNMWS